MTLQNLLSELQSVRLHPMADVNIESVSVVCGAVVAECEFNELEAVKDELASANDEIESREKQIKSAEEESTELTRQLEKTEAGLEADTDASELKRVSDSMEMFRKVAIDWSVEVEKARAELSAMRKKKGVAVGFIAQQSAILSLLDHVAHSDTDLKQRAKEILNQIHAQ
jgi:chromosome segregation ATPase